MEIVIKIPDDVYTRLFDNGIQDNEIATDDVCEMARALRLGTPLEVQPCEDCVSREELIKQAFSVYYPLNGENYIKVIRLEDVEKAPTVPMVNPCEDAVSRKRVIILIDEASEIHPYKVVGDSNTYSNYNQGWTDACDWLYANIDGIPSVKSQASEEDIHREREQAYMLGYEDASKKFRTEPCEDCISRQKALDCFEQTNTRQGAKYAIETLPSVTPRTNLAETSQDCISREAVIRLVEQYPNIIGNRCSGLISDIKHLPSVKPQYTDEEIDKAQAVEQAYVDNMVELAVEEIKERYSDAIGKMKKAIDEMTEIHSDGEFYIKNVDAKWIISKYLCGAEMSGGGEDEVSD